MASISTECINHTGEVNWGGYGRQWRGNKRYQAHRLAYCDAHSIPIDSIKGEVVRHKCDNPTCVNPDHLELGTQRDNMQDMHKRGRANTARGHRLPQTLDAAKVEQVRALLKCGLSQRTIASRTGVSQCTVSRILNGLAHG